MTRFAYIFERFPSFGQTFCYREVAELERQDIEPPIFSIRNPKDEPPQDWDMRIVERVHYLPDEQELLEDVRRAKKKGSSAQTLLWPWMNGGVAPISFGSTKRSTLDCACGKWESIMCTRISPAWLRALLSG
jgi:hypothetical protein